MGRRLGWRERGEQDRGGDGRAYLVSHKPEHPRTLIPKPHLLVPLQHCSGGRQGGTQPEGRREGQAPRLDPGRGRGGTSTCSSPGSSSGGGGRPEGVQGEGGERGQVQRKAVEWRGALKEVTAAGIACREKKGEGGRTERRRGRLGEVEWWGSASGGHGCRHHLLEGEGMKGGTSESKRSEAQSLITHKTADSSGTGRCAEYVCSETHTRPPSLLQNPPCFAIPIARSGTHLGSLQGSRTPQSPPHRTARG